MTQHDLLRTFFDLSPFWSGVVVAFAGPVWLTIVGLIRHQFDPKRPPWGLSAFRWNNSSLGDFFGLSGAVGCIDQFYRTANFESASFVTSREFSLLAAGLATLSALVYVGQEEIRRLYKGKERYSFTRIWHTGYFAALTYVIGTALARIAFADYSGGVMGAFLTGVFLGIYAVTSFLDAFSWKNPIWRWALRHYPDSDQWNL